jgi:hypothetical protein
MPMVECVCCRSAFEMKPDAGRPFCDRCREKAAHKTRRQKIQGERKHRRRRRKA